MSSQSASSHVVPATARSSGSSLGATIRRLARVVWRSYERHSLYQVMQATGDDGLKDEFAQGRHPAGQR
ncbi:MAG TPA: hypothetical protein VG105_17215 [Paraburkholderia sp.]|jgi:hypothetical protein|nr:hypothetical protein [Paraburkholderia sp.]